MRKAELEVWRKRVLNMRYKDPDLFRQQNPDFLILVFRETFRAYFRRNEITSWASDKNKPITVSVIMRPSGATCVGQPIYTPHVRPPQKEKGEESVAPCLFYAHHLFVQIFDGKNHARGSHERFFRRLILDFLNGDDKYWSVLSWPRSAELNLPSEAECQAASIAFFSRLRAFVDGFLQTGFDNMGIETPSSRRVRASIDEAPLMTISADEIPVVIFDEIQSSWLRNQPRPLLNGDGTTAIAADKPRWKGQDPALYARDSATYYFQELLDSTLSTRIGQCVNPTCKRYFIRKRTRKTAIKRGRYCGSCKLIGGAERTRASRDQLRQKMLQVAAEAWNEWGERGRRTNRAVWVAKQVNRVFGKTRFIQPKWVNQNRNEIETFLGQRHAEGFEFP